MNALCIIYVYGSHATFIIFRGYEWGCFPIIFVFNELLYKIYSISFKVECTYIFLFDIYEILIATYTELASVS